MENASTRLQYKVGIFVASGLTLAMAFILALGGDRLVFTDYMQLKAHFGQVQGLFPGSVVSLAGLPIGNVKDIYFVPGINRLEVLMQVDQEFASRIREGTTAEIRTQGALGDKFVYLEPASPDKQVVATGSLLESVGEEDILKALTSKENGVMRILDVIKEMHILIASLNQNNHVGNTMQNFSEASGQLKSVLEKIDTLAGEMKEQLPENKKFRQAVTSLASVLEKIDKGQGTLGALINDPSVHLKLKAFLGGSPRNTYMKEVVRESIQQNEATK